MITLSAFADEIGPDLELQMAVCQAEGIRCIDVRAIDGKNVSAMTVGEASEYRKRMQDRGFSVPCIGSPVGKIRLDEDFAAHLELLRHCADVAGAFGTRRIRVFSFYAPQGGDIARCRQEVLDRLGRMIRLAEQCDAVLFHENEKAIYGARPERVKDLFAALAGPRFRGIFDPANYVEEGVAPYDEAWKQGLDGLTDWFHIKDKVPGEPTCVPAGRGRGQIPQILGDLKARSWSGYMTLEPHMSAAGQFSGFTGPGLFHEAAEGLKKALEAAGLDYQ